MLDFSKLMPQMQALIDRQADMAPKLIEAAILSLETLGSADADWQSLAEHVRTAKTTWLMALMQESPASRHSLPERPEIHSVLAVDGSQVAPDRHETAFCYLLNVGLIALHYGGEERASLAAEPSLHFSDQELYEEFQGESQPISPRRIATRRFQAECAALGRLIEEAGQRESPAIALMDGTLILWNLEADDKSVRARVLSDFERLLDSARQRNVPVVGYISRPGSRDVINVLRAFLCGFNEAACGLKCSAGGPLRSASPCGGLQDITDAVLFDRLLLPGERSGVFESQSRILGQMHEANRIRFFYLQTGREIGRVEIPAWVAEDATLLERVHAVVHDQIIKGNGYPRALTEAHERAVIRGPERSAFFQILENGMARRRIPIAVTRKAISKRTRSV